ncbi:MAG: hypothetical protein ABL857_09345, partial [Rickettsiales bacterium]
MNYAFSGLENQLGDEQQMTNGSRKKNVELAVLSQVAAFGQEVNKLGGNVVGAFFECENVGKMLAGDEKKAVRDKLAELGIDYKQLDSNPRQIYSSAVRKEIADLKQSGDDGKIAVAEEIEAIKAILARPVLFGGLAKSMLGKEILKNEVYTQPELTEGAGFCEQLNCFFMAMPGYKDMPAIRQLAFLDKFYNYFMNTSVFEQMEANPGIKEMVENLENQALAEHQVAKDSGKKVGEFSERQYFADMSGAGLAAARKIDAMAPQHREEPAPQEQLTQSRSAISPIPDTKFVTVDLQALWSQDQDTARDLLNMLQNKLESELGEKFEYSNTTGENGQVYVARMARQFGEGSVTTAWFAPVVVIHESFIKDGKIDSGAEIVQGVVTELNQDGTPKEAYTTDRSGENAKFYDAAIEHSFEVLLDKNNKDRKGGEDKWKTADGETYNWPEIVKTPKLKMWEGVGEPPSWAHALDINYQEPYKNEDGAKEYKP